MRDMNLKIERRWRKSGYTVGILYVDGRKICETLEDTVRDYKVPGQTAIPAGHYVIDMSTISPRFRQRSWAKLYGGIVPRLMSVPGFEGILIHPGNTAADTEGCILVGRNREVGRVLDSQATYRRLMDEYLMPAKYAGQKITIEII